MVPALPGRLLLLLLLPLLPLLRTEAKWVEGRVNTKDNWAFLARFCFLSLEGQFEYLIEFDKDMGTPNLLLYYDDDNQWPAVYHSSKSCKDREAILNKAGQNQMIKLSHWYPETEFSGCVLTKENRELPSSKTTTTTTTPPTTTTKSPNKLKPDSNETKPDPTYYDQFLKTTARPKSTIVDSNSTIWYELLPTDFNVSSTESPEDEWESVGPGKNGTQSENLEDVELMFTNKSIAGHKIKRSTSELYNRFRRRRLNAESSQNSLSGSKSNVEKLIVSCHNSRRFRSARERWWFIAISNCDNNKGLDVRYRFLMTNGPEGDFWHEHFSADEFYVLPVLLTYTFAYVIVTIAVVICSIELKCRHLLHTTYKQFAISVILQHSGVLMQSLAVIKYAANGFGGTDARIVGQFFCGMSETMFLLLLILMAKGYTITRGRLKVSFTVKITVFMCCYIVTYVVLFIYQAKAFDPGEVLYLYESPAGYGLIVLRVAAWCMFAYSTFFTVRKYPEKNTFYCPFSICGTLWFYAGPLFILTANSYIDKWVRESVVTAVLLFITFCGHIMFLLLTLPVFANKNFPYHVRTTQIGVMEVTGNPGIDSFGTNPYQPTTNSTAQTVIIPLTRRTEELIGNMCNQYMASPPNLPLENETPKLNSLEKHKQSLSPRNRLVQQDSAETNSSDDIKPYIKDNKDIFTVESQMSKFEKANTPESASMKIDRSVLPPGQLSMSKSVLPPQEGLPYSEVDLESKVENGVNGLPNVLRARRTLLEPIRRDEVPSWSLAKGPAVVGMLLKTNDTDNVDPESPIQINGRKVPPVRNGLQASSGEISTILEGRVQSFKNAVSQPTVELFSARKNS